MKIENSHLLFQLLLVYVVSVGLITVTISSMQCPVWSILQWSLYREHLCALTSSWKAGKITFMQVFSLVCLWSYNFSKCKCCSCIFFSSFTNDICRFWAFVTRLLPLQRQVRLQKKMHHIFWNFLSLWRIRHLFPKIYSPIISLQERSQKH